MAVRQWRGIGLGLAALSLSGCVSIGRAILIPKFKIEVAGQQLKDIPASNPASPIAGAAPPSAEAASPPPPAPPAAGGLVSAPTRTEVRGYGDHSMKIDRVVITGDRPIAHRAPNYSPEQVAAMVCTSARFGFGAEAAKHAHESNP